MQTLIAYLVWLVFSSMFLRWGIYLGTSYDLGIISPMIIVMALQIFIAPFFINNKQ